MSSGMYNFGQGMQNLGAALGRLGQRQAEQASRQELIRAEQAFNRSYYEWQAAAADQRWDEVEQSYEQWLEQARNQFAADSEFFTSPETADRFSSWMEEAAAQRRVPVASAVAEQRAAHEQSVFESNVSSAIEGRDPEALVKATYAAADDGIIMPEQVAPTIEAGMYDINLGHIRSQVLEIGRKEGFDVALRTLEALNPADYQFVVGRDEAGNDIYTSPSEDDFATIRDEVREQLREQRNEFEYRIDETDRRWDETANALFRDNTLGDLLAFKAWLEGTNPETGEELPAGQNARDGMKASTWRTWHGLVTGLINSAEEEVDVAAREEAERAFMAEFLRQVENDADPRQLNELVITAAEEGILADPDKARTLINYNEGRNENPVYDSILDHINTLATQYELSDDATGRVVERFLSFYNSDATVQGADGRPVLNLDRTNSTDMARIASNIFYSAAGADVRAKARAAYNIRGESVLPQLGGEQYVEIGDRMRLDDAENLLTAIQEGQYMGWPQMGDEVTNQLHRLWAGQASMLESALGVRPVNSTDVSAAGMPLFQVETTRPRYSDEAIAANQEAIRTGQPSNLQPSGYETAWVRWVIPGERIPQELRRELDSKQEALQVWDPQTQMWRWANVGRSEGGRVQISPRRDVEGWPE